MGESHKPRRPVFSLTLRGQPIEIECFLVGADPDVGLQHDFEDELITDESGAVLDWELTEDEREQVNRHIDQCAEEP